MNDRNETGNYYTIGQLAMFTGLSDRTLRNHLASGILQGEKLDGVWHFTEEQAESFVNHPAVRPAILAKRNAVVYDFLADNKKKEPRACLILDFPGADPREISGYFGNAINNGDFHDLRFSMDGGGPVPRVILKGETRQVLELANGWYGRKA